MAGKGWDRSVKCNIPGMHSSSIDGLPSSGVAIFKDGADKAVEFCEKLREAMAPFSPGQVHFDNIDVSNTQWPSLAFSILLDVLQEKAASTKRLKAFKCGLDDECINCIGTWLETLDPQSLPSEIHLSNNQMTQRGLETIIHGLEAKRSQLPRKAVPVWLRAENNQVDIAAGGPVIKPLVDGGRVVHVTKIGDRTPSAAAVAMPNFKNLQPLRGSGQAQQAAPAPARMALPAAPAAAGGAGGAGNAWGGGYASVAAGGYSPYAAQGGVNGASGYGAYGAQGYAAGGYNPWGSSVQWNQGACWGGVGQWQQQPQPVPQTHQPAVVYPPAWQQPAAVTIAPARGSVAAAGCGGRAAQAGAAADRSRTPAPRQKQGPKLPPGWEEQWSDEYQIPYYWNSATGDALWEPPEE